MKVLSAPNTRGLGLIAQGALPAVLRQNLVIGAWPGVGTRDSRDEGLRIPDPGLDMPIQRPGTVHCRSLQGWSRFVGPVPRPNRRARARHFLTVPIQHQFDSLGAIEEMFPRLINTSVSFPKCLFLIDRNATTDALHSMPVESQSEFWCQIRVPDTGTGYPIYKMSSHTNSTV